MEFRILGAIEASVDGRDVPLGGQRPRLLLAALLLNAGRTVGTEELVDAVWDTRPPSSARTQLAIHVSGLRKAFAAAGATARVIETAGHGYRLDTTEVQVDAVTAERLVGEVRDGAAAPAPPAETVERLRSALALWRGKVLGGLRTPALEPAVRRLEELRLYAAEELFDIELAAGRHHELIGELSALLGEAPLRERMRAQLMTALWRAGRQAEALETYREGRRLLVDELGLEPGPDLRRLEEAILADDPPGAETDAGAPRAVPAELPGDIAAFSGRAAEARELRRLLARPGGGPVVIAGPGGIGKSALAVHVAHQARESYPDGHLYVDLHGATPDRKPVEPGEVLGRFLRSLGVAVAAIPADAAGAAALFRTETDGKRLLVLLDNAAGAAQVRSLLPGSRSCAVIVTSRAPLGSLDGAAHLRLDVLPAGDSVALLARTAGAERVRAEPQAAETVVELCGGLPLALGIAGARLAARPHWPVRTLADRLGGERRRLAELAVDDQAVRTSFMVSYADLGDPDVARMFRVAFLLDGPEVSVPVAAAMAEVPPGRAEDLLDRLVDVQLAQARGPGRYRVHDLLRLFARERAAEEEPADARARGVRRGLECYLATVHRTARLIDPIDTWRTDLVPRGLAHPGIPLGSRGQVDAWIGAERDNLMAAARRALTEDQPELAVGLVAGIHMSLEARGRWPEQLQLARIALEAAARTGDPRHRGLGHNDLGWTLRALGRPAEAVEHFERAASAWRDAGHRVGVGLACHGAGAANRSLGRYAESMTLLHEARDLFHELGNQRREGAVLTAIGLTLQRTGRYAESVAAHEESVRLARHVGARLLETMALGNLAEAHRLSGDQDAATRRFEEALSTGRSSGYSGGYWEAEHLWGLGLTRGDHAYLSRSAAILHDLGLITEADRDRIERDPSPETPAIIAGQL